MILSILGTEYKVTKKKYNDDSYFNEKSVVGWCNSRAKEILAVRGGRLAEVVEEYAERKKEKSDKEEQPKYETDNKEVLETEEQPKAE